MHPQRRVTFHLPDGSQESCSDSGLGDHEPSSGASTSHPLPLGFPQEEYYEQASPNSRTEGDGNSDPESMFENDKCEDLAQVPSESNSHGDWHVTQLELSNLHCDSGYFLNLNLSVVRSEELLVQALHQGNTGLLADNALLILA
ncbi:UNVERIFIED_CONTAM: hypothetical protein H355_008343 [Colinus virginianus]|nr:hypothetical protein H355_008343 [Colinus virginianus]